MRHIAVVRPNHCQPKDNVSFLAAANPALSYTTQTRADTSCAIPSHRCMDATGEWTEDYGRKENYMTFAKGPELGKLAMEFRPPARAPTNPSLKLDA